MHAIQNYGYVICSRSINQMRIFRSSRACRVFQNSCSCCLGVANMHVGKTKSNVKACLTVVWLFCRLLRRLIYLCLFGNAMWWLLVNRYHIFQNVFDYNYLSAIMIWCVQFLRDERRHHPFDENFTKTVFVAVSK